MSKHIKKPNLNSTALRIFKLLQWLSIEPLSVDELNQRFQADPLIQKQVSQDSIWLYINTLRELGCEISRPSPSNEFRHELQYHPFGVHLQSDELSSLIQARQMADQVFSYADILHLDQMFK